MSGALDKDAKNLALELIGEFGGVCTYTSNDNAVFDIETQTVTPNQTVTANVPFVFEKMSFGALQSGLATDLDVLIGIPFLSIEVAKVGDVILIDNLTYTVKSNLAVSSGSSIAYHRLICKVN